MMEVLQHPQTANTGMKAMAVATLRRRAQTGPNAR